MAVIATSTPSAFGATRTASCFLALDFTGGNLLHADRQSDARDPPARYPFERRVLIGSAFGSPRPAARLPPSIAPASTQGGERCCACYTGDTTSCGSLGAQGTCANGSATCSGGNWGGCSVGPASEDSCAYGNDDNCNGATNEACACIDGVTTQSCGVSGTNCTLGSTTCTNGHANAYSACTGNTCSDFTVAVNVDNACGPNCCSGTTCYWSNAVCSAGYHVTGCTVTNTGGHGSCTYDSASGGTASWHGVVHNTDAHCVLGSCTCRRDGF